MVQQFHSFLLSFSFKFDMPILLLRHKVRATIYLTNSSTQAYRATQARLLKLRVEPTYIEYPIEFVTEKIDTTLFPREAMCLSRSLITVSCTTARSKVNSRFIEFTIY